MTPAKRRTTRRVDPVWYRRCLLLSRLGLFEEMLQMFTPYYDKHHRDPTMAFFAKHNDDKQ